MDERYVQPPAGPPGGYYGGYVTPAPQPPRRRWWIFAVAAAGALLVAAVVVVASLILVSGGNKTFENKAAGMSFSYPSKWVTVTQDNLGEFGMEDSPELLRIFNQILLAYEPGPRQIYTLGVTFFSGSGKVIDEEEFERLKATLRDGATKSVERFRQDGFTVTEPVITQTQFDGAPAQVIEYHYSKNAGQMTDCQALVNAGNYRFAFQYTQGSPGTTGDTGTFDEIMESVRFEKR